MCILALKRKDALFFVALPNIRTHTRTYSKKWAFCHLRLGFTMFSIPFFPALHALKSSIYKFLFITHL